MATCPVCDTDNEEGLLWCKTCQGSLKYFGTVQQYYARAFKAPPGGGRKEPYKVMGLKKMKPMATDARVHAEERVRIQFRVLHIYAWMLEKAIIHPLDLVMWGSAPLQQGKAGGKNEAAHQILASLMVSPDDGVNWYYLYEHPRLVRCSPTVLKRVTLVLGALHATVSNIDKSYNDTDFIIELEIRALILSYIDEIRGIFIAREYNSKTWPSLWYSFRDDYVNLCKSLLDPEKRALLEHKDRKVDLGALALYIKVASDLRYEHSSKVKKHFKDIVNLSEGEGTWT